MARNAQPSTPPLLVWHQNAEIGRLQAERERLFERIRCLKPNAHKRVELTARPRELTNRQLMLQITIGERL